MTPLPFELYRDLARILHAIPSCVTQSDAGEIHFLLEVGSSSDYASDLRDVINEDCLLGDVEMDEDGDTLGLLVGETVQGHFRYVQLVLRPPYVAGPILVEGTVWPREVTQAEAIAKLEGLAYVDPDDAEDERQGDVQHSSSGARADVDVASEGGRMAEARSVAAPSPRTTEGSRSGRQVGPRTNHLRGASSDKGFVAFVRQLFS